MPELGPAIEDEARSRLGFTEADAFLARLELVSFDILEPLSQVYGLSLTNFSDVTQWPDAGIIARACLHEPAHVHSSTGRLTSRDGRIELPAWSFLWLTGT